jgi:aerobic-type carbon monoxide dehydrogenase small subunit (CoxS/CutS family)
MARIKLSVDGQAHTIEVSDPQMPLLYALRNELGLDNPRFGCGLAQCGACTVLMDGAPIRSCAVPVSAATGAITTLNALGTAERPHPVQRAFIEEQVPFCGYCTSGWVMHTVALLESNPSPTDEQIRQHLTGLKCRCGAHNAIMRAVKRAAALKRGGE